MPTKVVKLLAEYVGYWELKYIQMVFPALVKFKRVMNDLVKQGRVVVKNSKYAIRRGGDASRPVNLIQVGGSEEEEDIDRQAELSRFPSVQQVVYQVRAVFGENPTLAAAAKEVTSLGALITLIQEHGASLPWKDATVNYHMVERLLFCLFPMLRQKIRGIMEAKARGTNEYRQTSWGNFILRKPTFGEIARLCSWKVCSQ